jgi:peroxiredoxin
MSSPLDRTGESGDKGSDPFSPRDATIVGMRERMKAIIFFLVVGAVAAFFVYREVSRTGEPGVVNIGQQAPDFSIKDQQGRVVKLSDYRGKVVFLNIWGTWCQPCIEEMPEMETLNQKFKDKKFQMMAVSVDNDWEEVNEFYREHNLTMPAFLDPGRQVASLYKVFKYPETFLIDANGNVVKHTWQEHWADPRIMKIVENLILQAETKQQTMLR